MALTAGCAEDVLLGSVEESAGDVQADLVIGDASSDVDAALDATASEDSLAVDGSEDATAADVPEDATSACASGEACPCSSDADCASGQCLISADGKGTCALPCAEGLCPEGEICTAASGNPALQVCVPKPPCLPKAEICNGLDDDCNGSTDEGFCYDGNPCTGDVCDSQGVCGHPQLTGPCDDGNACTSGDFCKEGACLSGLGPECDDGNACTQDSCNTASGTCNHAPLLGGCSDGDACTLGDQCLGGKCLGGGALTCDDANPCTDDSCDKAKGCVSLPNAASCSDGDACTQSDSCSMGACLGKALGCDDGNLCTNDACQQGNCLNLPIAATCSDGNECTTADVCKSGVCAGQAIDCDDDSPCTQDSCEGGACQHLKAGDDTVCDDGNPCSEKDLCTHEGKCVGVAKSCDDGNPCTVDLCQKDTGACQSEPTQGQACDDGNPCTLGDACTLGACVPGGPKVCKDGVVCTDDSCDPATGKCVFASVDNPCDDGNPCTLGDLCDAGLCTSGKAKDCDDNNPCTIENCDSASGECKIANTVAGVACEDGELCTQADACKDGKCVAGKSINCTDGNACTADSCDPLTGKCAFAPQNGKACDDGDACSAGDSCQNGQCSAGKPVCECKGPFDCIAKEDGNACNGTLYCDLDDHKCKLDLKTVVVCDTSKDSECLSWACNGKTGQCEPSNQADAKPCNADGSICSVGDSCLKGLCVPGAGVGCDDGNPCTNDSCDPVGGCQHSNNQFKCSDGNPCTEIDLCYQGKCSGGGVKVCDDGNACTSDSCNPKNGMCVYTNETGAGCTDNNPCTLQDTCQSGKCVPKSNAVCDDGKTCTLDTCDTKTGKCVTANMPDQLACEDGNKCTMGDACKAGVCTAGKPAYCNDGSACTIDTCDLASGICVYKNASDGTACSDGDSCTIGDKCAQGGCIAGPAKDCNDGNPCTLDKCDIDTGKCIAKSGDIACDDGNACTEGDTCTQGICKPKTFIVCNDGNTCTDDSCDVATGKCIYKPNTYGCTDGNACTYNDACVAGGCKGTAITCNDGNFCTADSCDSVKGCQYVASNQGVACDDGNACTASDACANGGCKGTGITCSDGNPCTSDVCNTKTGCVFTQFSGPCNDGNGCTVGDVCTGGKCISGASKVCNDNNGCTVDSCNSSIGQCVFTVDDKNPCTDNNACTTGDFCASGKCQAGVDKVTCQDTNPCTSDWCDPASGCKFVSNQAQPCDDGNSCTLKDICLGGKCLSGTQDLCDDANPCTTDSCDPQKGCSHAPNTLPCDDGDACKSPDICAGGKCLSGPGVSCKDGNSCTSDTCDPKFGCNFPAITGSCDDGNLCTTVDVCQNGACTGIVGDTCDDGNSCTSDFCQLGSGCQHIAKDGNFCEDGDACTVGDVCTKGKCASGTKASCDDGQTCTVDSCDGKLGCSYAPASNGKGKPLTFASSTGVTLGSGGQAVATWVSPLWTKDVGGTWLWSGPIVADATVTTSATFNYSFDIPAGFQTVVGTISLAVDGAWVCKLGGKLVGVETAEDTYTKPVTIALNGKLQAGTNVLSCTVTNPGKAGASATSNPAGINFKLDLFWFEQGGATPCNDGNACTDGDWCQISGSKSSCQAGAVSDCDDSNGCTSDFCDPTQGCGHKANAASECDDGNPCTVSDVCQAGTCKGGASANCGDNNPCTADKCDAKTGCSNPAVDGGSCSDGNACTSNDICKDGKCSAANGATCDDGNPCTTDLCSPLQGCYYTLANGGPCDDGNLCTADDLCSGGSCLGKLQNSCSDGNPCTADLCDGAKGCVSTAVNAGSCDDANPCTLGDGCKGGVCSGGTAKPCFDSQPCTLDMCDPKSGSCVFTPVADEDKCEDGNPCTVSDKCASGKCNAGPLRECGDGNPCSDDACDPSTGSCVSTVLPGNYACDDGDPCTLLDTCATGSCAGKNKDCTDGDKCTVDSCNSVTGKCFWSPVIPCSP
jgi:hypothetical protein